MMRGFLLAVLVVFVLSNEVFSFHDECTDREKSKCFPKGCVYSEDSDTAKCQKCTEDYHCWKNPKYVCDEMKGKCQMRSMFDFTNYSVNITWYEGLSFVVCFFSVLISTIGGVGGGIILVSSLLAIGQFHIKSISPLSSSLVFGASMCAVLMTLLKKHPEAKRPMIDWNFVATVEPIVLSGTLIGVILNAIFPPWLTLLVLAVIVVIAFYKVTTKGCKMYKKENAAKEVSKHQGLELPSVKPIESETEDEETNLTSELESTDLEDGDDDDEFAQMMSSLAEENTTAEENEGGESLYSSIEETDDDDESESAPTDGDKTLLDKLLWWDSIQLPIHKMLILLFAWIVILVVSLLKGSKRAPSIIGLERCSLYWWLTIIIAFPILFGSSYIYAFFMNRRHKNNIKAGFEYLPTDLQWDMKQTILVPAVFIISGIVAALIGTGGGLINGPIMIAMGMDAQVMTATNLLMIFMTSSSGFTQFMVAQKIPYDYALVMIVIGFFAAFFGRSSASLIVKKTGRRSVIIFVLSALIVVAGIASFGVGVFKIYNAYVKGENMWFKSLC